MLRDGPRQRRRPLVRRRLGGRRRQGDPARCSAPRSPTSSTRWRSSTASCASARSGSRSAGARPTCRRPRRSARQHYRLQHWRQPERNVRRFFTIDDLVAVRVEEPEVAAAVDTVPRLLAGHDGVRRRARRPHRRPRRPARLPRASAAADRRRPLAARREDPRPRRAPARLVAGRRDDRLRARRGPRARHCSTRMAGTCCGGAGSPRPAIAARSATGSSTLGARCSRPGCARTSSGSRASPPTASTPPTRRSRQAVAELSVHLDRYRTYLPDDEGEPALTLALAEAAASQPQLAPVARPARHRARATATMPRRSSGARAGSSSPARRRRRASRTGRSGATCTLASLDEVGGFAEPDADVDPVAALHEHHAATAARWPTTLLAGTTHDTKRSEDVRAAGLALATRRAPLRRARRRVVRRSRHPVRHRPVDPVAGAADGRHDAGPRRSAADGRSSSRPAGRPTCTRPGRTPTSPTSVSSAASPTSCCSGRRSPTCRPSSTVPGGPSTLALLAVRLTAPGVADVYQGTEALRYLLVDPDNRTPPDHDALDELVASAASLDGRAAWAEPGSPAARAVVIRRLLGARHDLDLAGYAPLDAGEHLVAFARLDAERRARARDDRGPCRRPTGRPDRRTAAWHVASRADRR